MSERKLIILHIETNDANMPKALKHLDDALDIMKATHSINITQYHINTNEFNQFVKSKSIKKRSL
ncbi:unnamed protein product [marine sediment metagenome]|uniref:Uncharacterized protein n=1 Tax=marine sediment metagenome TaxID=412755 RepID=X0TPT0_9ZZZZ